jgi:hypothetical protein
MATIQVIYNLAGLQTQGFLQLGFELTKLDDEAPPEFVSVVASTNKPVATIV